MHEMLAHAGEAHNIDEDLLASVVRAESGGQVRAVSRTGAQGLMQLMPGTASASWEWRMRFSRSRISRAGRRIWIDC